METGNETTRSRNQLASFPAHAIGRFWGEWSGDEARNPSFPVDSMPTQIIVFSYLNSAHVPLPPR